MNKKKIKRKFGGNTTIHTWKTVKVWWKYNNSDMKKCMKIPNKCNNIKGRSITCSYIWHVYTSKCVFQLHTHSVKVWWQYVLPNSNATHFCDVFFRHRVRVANLPWKIDTKIKNSAPLKSTTIIYLTFSKYFRPLDKLV